METLSFLERVSPGRKRQKLVKWPLPVEGEPVTVQLNVLGTDALEGAYFDAVAHFKGKKPTPTMVVIRERIELVFRSVRKEDGTPLTETADELAAYPSEILAELYAMYSEFQNSVAVPAPSQEALNEMIAALKKNFLSVPLADLHSTWLIGLITTLVSQLGTSTTESASG